MKNELVNIPSQMSGLVQPTVALSFGPLVAELEARSKEDKSAKSKAYKELLDYIDEQGIPTGEITLDQVCSYDGLMERLYFLLSPPLIPESKLIWGICAPVTPLIFYGTDLLYEVLGHPGWKASGNFTDDVVRFDKPEMLRVAYTLIMQRLYDFKVPVRTSQHFPWPDKATGTVRYLVADFNVDFLEVVAKGELPEIDFGALYGHIFSGDVFAALGEILPLDNFIFRGMMVIRARDVTVPVAIERLKDISIGIKTQQSKDYDSVVEMLKMIVESTEIEFDLLPFFRINNRLVRTRSIAGSGIMLRIWEQQAELLGQNQEQIEAYASAPEFIFCHDLWSKENIGKPELDAFRRVKAGAIALLPVYHNLDAVGMLCMHTKKGKSIHMSSLGLLEPALEPIAQMLYSLIDIFRIELDEVIKEKFTSVQAAVQWKFNETAWHYLYHQKNNQPAPDKPIRFEGLYPLYGAIDIRDSTLQRDNAVKSDLQKHLKSLENLLSDLRALPHLQLSLMLQQVFHECRKWKDLIAEHTPDASEELNLNAFLQSESFEYLTHLSAQDSEARVLIAPYFQAVAQSDGWLYQDRQELEHSMQKINMTINNFLESETRKLQDQYPFYFEKFRTDGVEYDIYIGQALAPGRPFSHFHLRDIRLWQMFSMVKLVCLVGKLNQTLPKPLETTQLIFVHNHQVDISFREDEKKFDVEGAYNIRYQMTKKRIDKIRVLGSLERLSQPGKVALIYSHEKDVEDYLPFIDYLKDEGQLQGEVEQLLLEEMPGVNGLRALRVTVSGSGPSSIHQID